MFGEKSGESATRDGLLFEHLYDSHPVFSGVFPNGRELAWEAVAVYLYAPGDADVSIYRSLGFHTLILGSGAFDTL